MARADMESARTVPIVASGWQAAGRVIGRTGAGRVVLNHILAEARRRGYKRLSLETGPAQTFGAAHRLYESVGFSRCGPFGDYKLDPHSVFMTLEL